jgi:hypothetical protein
MAYQIKLQGLDSNLFNLKTVTFTLNILRYILMVFRSTLEIFRFILKVIRSTFEAENSTHQNHVRHVPKSI